jgi:hypothetical protein
VSGPAGNFNWNAWIDYIQQQEVVPVLGTDTQAVLDGREIHLYPWLAERLIEKYQLSQQPADATLTTVVAEILNQRLDNEALVYAGISDIVRTANLQPSEWLRKLARITDFNLFVTSSFDPLLETALNEERFQGEKRTIVINNSLRKVKDLPEGFEDSRDTYVFHIMGSLRNPPYFAVTENDQLEFLCGLQNMGARPERLFSVLKEKHLLVLGSNYPDWAGRFMLRTLRNDNLSKRSTPSMETLAGAATRNDANLTGFLRQFSKGTVVYLEGGSDKFIDQLESHWREAKTPDVALAAATAPATSPARDTSPAGRPRVFISYAHEDIAAVRVLRDSLNPFFTVWMDENDLKEGDEFDRKIKQQIETCDIFIPVISTNTEARPRAYFRREWNLAISLLPSIHQDVRFIHPVTIHQLSTVAVKLVNDEFKRFQWTYCPEGRPPPYFLSYLR